MGIKRFFRYSGSKCFIQYINKVNEIIKYDDSKIYVEPFVGSGGILFNLNKEFDKYIINDIDRNIIRIYKTFKEISYEYYLEKTEEVFKKFGDFRCDRRYISKNMQEEQKRNFYKFRDWFNSIFWNSETIDEGIYLHMLANSVINSFLRFGPNGMNNSYGLRFYYIDRESFNYIKMILNKTEFYNTSYKEIYKLYPDDFYLLDPPYFSQESSYSGFSEDDLKEFLELTKDKKFIYFDIKNKLNAEYANQIFIRYIRNTSSSTNKEVRKENSEYLFTSLDIHNIQNKYNTTEIMNNLF